MINFHRTLVTEKDGRGLSLLDECIASKNNDLINMLFNHETTRYFDGLEKRLRLFRSLLGETTKEDFCLDIKWSVHSSVVPLVQTMLPHDSIRIIKHKDCIRVDFSALHRSVGEDQISREQNQNPFGHDFSLIIRNG